jgi:hypothetical protein
MDGCTDFVDVFSLPSPFTGNDLVWSVTLMHTVIWTVFHSPLIFRSNNTVVDFTHVKNSVIVIITVFNDDFEMFLLDFIFHGDGTRLVGIIIVENFSSDISNISTRPSTITSDISEWTVTIDVSESWTVFISPLIFTHNNTSMDFTGINVSIIVLITVFLDDF